MKIPRLFSLLVLTGIAVTELIAADAPNTLTEVEKAAGWKLLFDGKTSAGWVAIGKTVFPSPGWVVSDGLLKRTDKGGDIVTTESYTDFELTWEWNVSMGGNSGLKYNLPDPKKGLGFEYQLIDDLHHPDGVKGGRLQQTAGLYDLIEPAIDKRVNPPGSGTAAGSSWMATTWSIKDRRV